MASKTVVWPLTPSPVHHHLSSHSQRPRHISDSLPSPNSSPPLGLRTCGAFFLECLTPDLFTNGPCHHSDFSSNINNKRYPLYPTNPKQLPYLLPFSLHFNNVFFSCGKYHCIHFSTCSMSPPTRMQTVTLSALFIALCAVLRTACSKCLTNIY